MRPDILIAEDDSAIQRFLKDLLEAEGYSVAAAYDGLQALEEIAKSIPALLILDLGMPRMDGVSLLQELVSLGLREEFPVLVLTARYEGQREAQRLGVEGWLTKPFEIDDLVAEVSRLMED